MRRLSAPKGVVQASLPSSMLSAPCNCDRRFVLMREARGLRKIPDETFLFPHFPFAVVAPCGSVARFDLPTRSACVSCRGGCTLPFACAVGVRKRSLTIEDAREPR